MSTTASPTTATLPQRLRRFLDEDAATFAFTTVLGAGAFFARELHALKASGASSINTRCLQLAVRKTLPVLPAVLVSSAVGIVGMKLTLAAVQDARRDYSRTSLLLAVPVFAAIVHAPGGPRLMAKAVVGYGGFILAADYAAYNWHRYNALHHEQLHEQHEQADASGSHFLHERHLHLHDSDALIRRGVAPHAHHADTFGRDGSSMLVQRLANE